MNSVLISTLTAIHSVPFLKPDLSVPAGQIIQCKLLLVLLHWLHFWDPEASENSGHMVCKGCVLHGRPEPSAIKWSCLRKMSSYVINCSCLNLLLIGWWWLIVPQFSLHPLSQRKRQTAIHFGAIHEGSWCSVYIREMKAAFEGCFKLGQPCQHNPNFLK